MYRKKALLHRKKGENAMKSSFLRRTICRIAGILFGIITIIAIVAGWTAGEIAGFILLACDIVVIAVKNRCPFCHKQLRIAPIRGGEYCPHCGCEINNLSL